LILETSFQLDSVNPLALFLKPLSPAEAGCIAETMRSCRGRVRELAEEE